MSTIPPFVFFSAIPIAAVVIWLVARSVMRSEIRASNQLVERRRKEWRAGGCVGPKPGKYRGPERSDWRGWTAGGGPGMGGGGFEARRLGRRRRRLRRRRRRRLRRRRQQLNELDRHGGQQPSGRSADRFWSGHHQPFVRARTVAPRLRGFSWVITVPRSPWRRSGARGRAVDRAGPAVRIAVVTGYRERTVGQRGTWSATRVTHGPAVPQRLAVGSDAVLFDHRCGVDRGELRRAHRDDHGSE